MARTIYRSTVAAAWRGRRWRFAAPLAGMLGIEWLLVRPLPVEMHGGGDKIAHAAAFGLLALLWWWALPEGRAGWERPVTAVFIATVWGALGEVQQIFTPGRTAEVTDVVADLAGAAVVVGVAAVWRRRQGRRTAVGETAG